MLGLGCQPDQGQQFCSTRAAIDRRYVVQQQRKLHVFACCQHGKQVVALEDKAHLAAPQRSQLLFVEMRQVMTVEQYLPGRRLVKPTDQVEQRRFAAAAWPHDSHEFTALQRDIDCTECRNDVATHAILAS